MFSLTNIKSCGKICSNSKASYRAPYIFDCYKTTLSNFQNHGQTPVNNFFKTMLWLFLLTCWVHDFNFFIWSYSVLISIMFLSRDSREQCGCTHSGGIFWKEEEMCFSKSSWATFGGKGFWSAEQVKVKKRTRRSLAQIEAGELWERQRRHIQPRAWADANTSPRLLRGDWEDFLTVQEATENCGLRKRPEHKHTLRNGGEGRNGLKTFHFHCLQVSSF